MNKSFVIALALILALIRGSNGNQRDEAKCSSRRCCSMRDELHEYDLPPGLNCRVLTDRECGAQDSYCEWDCDEVNPMRNNKNIRRRYRGIAGEDINDEPVQAAMNKKPAQNADKKEYTNKQLLEKCLSEGGKGISHDDCGVEYKEEVKNWDDICHQLYDDDKNHHNDYFKHAGKKLEQDDGKRRLGVIGPDGRTLVDNMDAYPYNAVMYMKYDVPNDPDHFGFCTATMISDNVAITAAHCVWSPAGWHFNIKLFYKIDDCNERNSQQNAGNYYEYVLNSVWISQAFKDNFDPNRPNSANDMALIRVNTNGRTHGTMGFGSSNSFQTGTQFSSIGYPGDKKDKFGGEGCSPYEQKCPYKEFDDTSMKTYECDYYPGQSGSGIYRWDAGDSFPTIYGLVSNGNNIRNDDCRINAEKYKEIENYLGI